MRSGLRLARCLAFVRDRPGDNEWAHPLDGLIALVDLNALEVLRVDDHGVVPLPPEAGNFARPSVPDARPTSSRFEIIQPDGPSFTVDGNEVSLAEVAVPRRLHPARRAGAAPGQLPGRRATALDPVSRVALRDGRALRRSQPDALLQERLRRRRVRRRHADPLAGASAATAWARSTTSTPSCRDADGAPVPIKNAICLHEEDVGVLWKHIDWRTGAVEVRRSRRLVISLVRHRRQLRLRLLLVLLPGRHDRSARSSSPGSCTTGAVRPGERPRHGVEVAPGLNATFHQHFFNCGSTSTSTARRNTRLRGLDTAAPGRPREPARQRVRRRRHPAHRGEARPAQRRSARGAVLADRQSDAQNRLGQPVGYRLVPGENAVPVRAARCGRAEAGGLHHEHLWVTPYDAERALRGRRLPEPASRRRRPAGLDRRRPPDRRTPTWWSGTRSATTTCRAPRTGR